MSCHRQPGCHDNRCVRAQQLHEEKKRCPLKSSSLVCAAATEEEEPTQLLSLRLLTLDSLSLSPVDLLVDSRPSSLDQLF